MRLSARTASEWLTCINDDLDTFLKDHASCEKKAVGTALALASHYPDRTELVEEMLGLAQEELSHYRDVFRLLATRGQTLGRDEKDPYIGQLLKVVRQGSEFYLLDRLLVFAIVEARGSERFRILGEGIADTSLRDFYRRLARAEACHWALFVRLAKSYFAVDHVNARLEALLQTEGEIVSTLPVRCALH